MTARIAIRIPALPCIQTHVVFVNPMYTKCPPLGIPEGIKKYIKSPVAATLRNKAVRIRSIK